ncbi:shikimate kinase [Salinibacterium sp. SYSU T00001]|uniref:shikimate kinase n=1 Tax=Homoserinimonas sedimenticola TaxID=2986805 RepID=UPI00223643B2|nr:shikimate kinase [Salinibacterium sedimenticola]MCW4384336.1 shikimate kinase [Salinibacterium sedimenticola]
MATTPLVTFIGAPGSGKTRIGKRVARHLGVPFIDTDKRIVAEHGPIADIFERFGEPHFRRLEREAVVAALREPAVVSLGGGAIISADTRADLAKTRVVRLVVSAEAVASRITGGKRPLLGAGVEAWKALVEQRQPLYDSVPSRIWDTSSRPIDHIAEEIAEWVAADAGISLPTSVVTERGSL